MTGRPLLPAALAVLAMTGHALADPAPAPTTPDDTLKLLSVDVRTLPAAVAQKNEAPSPQWRTSFGSERRSEPARTKPATDVDADIVLLQGVTDVPTLRRWFPAGQWRLVVSRQLLAPPDTAANVASTAVAVRLRRGLRLTGQDHVMELAGTPGQGPQSPAAAGTAVRVLIENRETWALSVLLPDDCAAECPAHKALQDWHQRRAAENVRRVTGGRFVAGSAGPAPSACAAFGLRLDPEPPPPRPAYTPAVLTPALGCAASVAVAK